MGCNGYKNDYRHLRIIYTDAKVIVCRLQKSFVGRYLHHYTSCTLSPDVNQRVCFNGPWRKNRTELNPGCTHVVWALSITWNSVVTELCRPNGGGHRLAKGVYSPCSGLSAVRLDVFKHPAHSPDLSTCDFHVFGPETPTFTSDGDGREDMVQWLLGRRAKNCLQMGIRRLVHQGVSSLHTSCDCFIIVPVPWCLSLL
jgi:hypothetical protein